MQQDTTIHLISDHVLHRAQGSRIIAHGWMRLRVTIMDASLCASIISSTLSLLSLTHHYPSSLSDIELIMQDDRVILCSVPRMRIFNRYSLTIILSISIYLLSTYIISYYIHPTCYIHIIFIIITIKSI